MFINMSQNRINLSSLNKMNFNQSLLKVRARSHFHSLFSNVNIVPLQRVVFFPTARIHHAIYEMRRYGKIRNAYTAICKTNWQLINVAVLSNVAANEEDQWKSRKHSAFSPQIFIWRDDKVMMYNANVSWTLFPLF